MTRGTVSVAGTVNSVAARALAPTLALTFIPALTPTATASAPPARPCAEEPGSHIGAYRLVQPIGTGGMGAVWLAQQEWPIRRKVALKVIKLGMDTAQVTARFEAERQALALMDHPNIARALDAGASGYLHQSRGVG